MVFTVSVKGIQSSPLPIVANRAAEIGKFMAAFPQAIDLTITQSFGIWMRTQRLGMIFEPRIVIADVAGSATINTLFAKGRNNDLFNARAAAFQRGTLGVGFGHCARLIEVSRLMALPFVEKLVVEDKSVNYQNHETRNG